MRRQSPATARPGADATDLPSPSGGTADTEPRTPPSIPANIVARIDTIATDFVNAAVRDRFDPARNNAIAEMGRLGASELLAGSIIERRLADRRDGRFQAEIAGNLKRLRQGVEELQHEIVAGRTDAKRSARIGRRIDDVLQALGDGSRALEQDTAMLLQEQHVLRTQVQMLERYAFMAERMDERLSERLRDLGAQAAALVRDDVVLPLRSRRADLATQLAVALQASAALRIVEQNNRDLIGAVRTATGTTIAALRTSQLVGDALRQRMDVGRAVAAQGVGMAAAAVAARVGAASLQDAWDDVFAAIQRVEDVKQHVIGDWPARSPGKR